MQYLDTVIVGAGPAGIGMALELEKISGLNYGVLESNRVGESFRRWPTQTRLITPSFNSNPFGLADLNSVDAFSSAATFAGAEHLSGPQYADYLSFVAETDALPIVTGCKVLEVNPTPNLGFHLITERGEVCAQTVIWACGEYQFPNLNPFPGGEWCRHYAHIEDWSIFEKDHYTVIGGYESGLDSAINLLKMGCHVRLLVRSKTWDLNNVYDPSYVLSPYTRDRLREVESNERLEIIYDVNVVEVKHDDNQHRSVIYAKDGRTWETEQLPILGTGFLKGGGARQIADLWEWDDKGRIVLTGNDESTTTPGLFLVGPQVHHENGIYCFIYKFRQRFQRIAQEVALRLSLENIAGSESQGSWGPFGNTDCCEGCEC